MGMEWQITSSLLRIVLKNNALLNLPLYHMDTL